MATIEDVMRERGLTRYRLSKDSGIPWATLSDICTGRTDLRRCTVDTALKLSRALGMTIEEALDLETGEVSSRIAHPDEAGLPEDLERAIDELLAGGDAPDDCLLDELSGSINANLHAGRITGEQAARLRSRYLE